MHTQLPQINAKQLKNKTVLLRLDLNLVCREGQVIDQTRWDVVVPTVRMIMSAQPKKVLILSHFGRPSGNDPTYSTRILLPTIQKAFPDAVHSAQDGFDVDATLVLLENVRFDQREYSNDITLSRGLLKNIDCLVYDAFSVGHRSHASVTGVVAHAPEVQFGDHFIQEKKNIDLGMNGQTPTVAIVGGAKVSTKLSLIESLLDSADKVIVGGGIANTFLAAKGVYMGSSLIESDSITIASAMLKRMGNKIILPIDGVTEHEQQVTFAKDTLKDSDKIVDVGPSSIEIFLQWIQTANTIIWNGPLGFFEKKPFDKGSLIIAQAIAKADAYTIVGGGDSVSLINELSLMNDFSYVSTSGGAFLEYVAHGSLKVLDTWSLHHETH